MSIAIVIPARRSSSRLKNKNILKIKVVSLINRAINFSKKIKFCKKIIITTDIPKSKINFDQKETIFIKRPKHLAGNKSKIYKTIIYIDRYLKKKKKLKINSILMLQPTSPFRSINQINKAYKIFKKNKMKFSLISLTEIKAKKNQKNHLRLFNIKKNKLFLQNKNNNKKKLKRFMANGNFYFTSINFLKKNKSFVKDKNTIPFIINNKKLSVDIDERKDYLYAKKKA